MNGRSRRRVGRRVLVGILRLAVAAGIAAVARAEAAPAAGPAILPIEELFAEPQDAAALLSPDGRSLAYLAPWQGKANLWVRPAGGGKGVARVVTRETARPIADFRWSDDGRFLVYPQDRGGDENFHLYAVAAGRHAGKVRDLTPFARVQAEIVAFPSRRPRVVVATLNRRDPELADAYRIDLATGALDLAAENPGNFLGYLADDRGQVRAAWALDSEGRYQIHARISERQPWRSVRVYPVEDDVKPLRFHPDGRRIYLTSNHAGDLSRLALLDLATGEESEVDADPLGRVDLDLALFDEKTGKPIATRYFDDLPRWIARDPRVEKALALASRTRQGAVTLASWTADRQRWVVTIEAPNDPGATYLLDIAHNRATLLSESRPQLAAYPLAGTQPVRLTARDGLALSGYLTLPPRAEHGPLPLVLAVHGGPWDRDRWGFDPEAQLFANRGYAVLQVNFRGSTGFGKKFARAAKKEFGRAMQTDLLDAVAWAVKAGIADPRKVAILGGSYGGYAVLEALATTPEAFACGVDYAGPSDLVTLIEAFPPSWRPFLARRWYPFVGNPAIAADRDDLLSRSPLSRIDAIVDPLLIFQGANDPRVTRAQSDAIVAALAARGVPVTYLLAGNEGHSFGNRETAFAVRRATELFFRDCLGGRAQATVTPETEATLRALTQISLTAPPGASSATSPLRIAWQLAGHLGSALD